MYNNLKLASYFIQILLYTIKYKKDINIYSLSNNSLDSLKYMLIYIFYKALL